MMPIFAETVATNVNWSLIATIIMAVATFGMWWDSRKQRKVSLDQPVDVRLVKALHEEFAHKEDFDRHRNDNTARHAQLFGKIDNVEKQTREAMDRRFALLAEDRAESLEKLNEQFQFIRESIVELKTEIKLRRHE